MGSLIAYETTREQSDIRFFEDIKIEVDFPFSEISFNYKDFEIASEIVALQFLGGYNDKDEISRVIYLNDVKIQNNVFFIWEDQNKFIEYINQQKSTLKEKNKYTVKLKNKNQYEYIRHTLIERDI